MRKVKILISLDEKNNFLGIAEELKGIKFRNNLDKSTYMLGIYVRLIQKEFSKIHTMEDFKIDTRSILKGNKRKIR